MKKNRDRSQLCETKIVFRKEDLPWVRDRIQEGQTFRIKRKEECIVKKIHYKVPEKFTYHASCVDDYGQRRSFNYFDLYKMLYGVV